MANMHLKKIRLFIFYFNFALLFCFNTILCHSMPLNGNIDIDFSSEELKCWIENRTVKISVERGSVRNVGSGFIYCMKLKSNIIPIIVTNRHVVENGRKIILSIIATEKSGKKGKKSLIDYEIPAKFNKWIFHPESDVDIAIIIFDNIINDIEKKYNNLSFNCINDSINISQKDFDNMMTFEDIAVSSYHINDSDPNLEDLKILFGEIIINEKNDIFNNYKIFTNIDIGIGSAGSPVFLYSNNNFYYTKHGIVAGNRIILVGVLAYTLQYRGQSLMPIEIPTHSDQNVVFVDTKSGYIINSYKLESFKAILNDLLRNSH